MSVPFGVGYLPSEAAAPAAAFQLSEGAGRIAAAHLLQAEAGWGAESSRESAADSPRAQAGSAGAQARGSAEDQEAQGAPLGDFPLEVAAAGRDPAPSSAAPA